MRDVLVVPLVLLITLLSFPRDGCTDSPNVYGLPKKARILETRLLAKQGYGERLLILWMLNPQKHPRSDDDNEPYTCPDETRGSYWSGPVRVTLFDTRKRQVINTINIRTEWYDEEPDSLDLPYRIHAGSYYHVPNTPKGKEGRPLLMWLRDYNGDGRALEFALFDAQACMGLPTTLIGYSPKRDRVIQYPIKLVEQSDDGPPRQTLAPWCDYLFSEPLRSPGFWDYSIDYRGRGGSLRHYVIRYDPKEEIFRGTLKIKNSDD